MTDDLFCCERLQPEPTSEKDPAIFNDLRVLQNLITLQKLHRPATNYFNTVQTDIKPFMRQVVCVWMSEVCEELNSEDQVFPTAVNLLDRFLSVCQIHKRHLQLAASVCIMMASKVRQTHTIRPETMCYYADQSFSQDDVKDWELLVLSKLQWDVTAVTAYDFLDHLIDRVGLGAEDNRIRQHAVALAEASCTDLNLLLTPPSVVAAACLTSVVRGIKARSAATALESMCDLLEGTTPEMVEPVVMRIEEVIVALEASDMSTPAPNGMATPHKRSSVDSHPETPTDISEIHF